MLRKILTVLVTIAVALTIFFGFFAPLLLAVWRSEYWLLLYIPYIIAFIIAAIYCEADDS